jgi:hypothetical protein
MLNMGFNYRTVRMLTCMIFCLQYSTDNDSIIKVETDGFHCLQPVSFTKHDLIYSSIEASSVYVITYLIERQIMKALQLKYATRSYRTQVI